MKKVLFVLVSTLAPVLVLAQAQPNLTYVTSGVFQIFNLATTYVIPGLMLLATGWFIWGVIKYIKADAATKDKERHALIQAVIGLAVIVSVWGLVGLLQNIFGVKNIPATNVVCPPGYTAAGANCIPL